MLKRILRFFSLLLCLAICFTLFSSGVYASSVVDGHTVVSSYYVYSKLDKTEFDGSFTLNDPHSSFNIVYDIYLAEPLERDTTFDFLGYFMFGGGDISLTSFTMYDDALTYAGDGSPTFDGNKVELLGAVNSARPCSHIELVFNVTNPTWSGDSTFGYTYYFYEPESVGGTRQAITGDYFGGTVGVMDNGWYLECKSVTNYIYTYNGLGTFVGVSYDGVTYTSGQTFSVQTMAYGGKYLYVVEDWEGNPTAPVYTYESACNSVTVTPVSDSGLLSGIIAWLKKIWDTITSLPGRIADAILNGIKSLFIPSEEVIVNIKSSFESLLADRFGAVYESFQILDDFFVQIQSASTMESFTVPEVTINVGVPFTFGGWEVKLIPDGFDFLADACKWLISVTTTFAFLLGMKKRFEEVLGR